MWLSGIRNHRITPILSDERPPVGAGGPNAIDRKPIGIARGQSYNFIAVMRDKIVVRLTHKSGINS